MIWSLQCKRIFSEEIENPIQVIPKGKYRATFDHLMGSKINMLIFQVNQFLYVY